METGDENVVTHIKYEKTSCYFCNEWLDSEGFPVSLFSDHFFPIFFLNHPVGGCKINSEFYV